MRLALKLMSVLPLWLLHAIGGMLGWAVFLMSGVYRRRFLQNAHQAGVGVHEWRLAVGQAGKMVTELPRLWLGTIPVVQWRGQEHVEQAISAGRGVIVLTPHLGSFEASAQAYALLYGQSGHPLTVLFRPPRQAWLRNWVVASRTRPGMASAPTNLAGVRQLLRALKRGESVALLPDQVPPEGQGLWTPFFGRDAYTMTLSARLASQTGATVLIAWCERLTWGRGYIIHVTRLVTDISGDLAQATVHINRAMEAVVRQSPGQYLWGYARYKAPTSQVVGNQTLNAPEASAGDTV